MVRHCSLGDCPKSGEDRVTAIKKTAALLALFPFIAFARPPTITRQNMTPEAEKQYRGKLEEAQRVNFEFQRVAADIPANLPEAHAH